MSDLAAALAAAPSVGFRADGRFGGLSSGGLSLNAAPDRVDAAYSDGYAKGFAEGAAQADARAAEDAALRENIELSLGRMSDAEQLVLEARLRETVLALCEQTLAPLAVEPDALTGRIGKALALMRRTADERLLRLHPADLELLAGRLPEGLHIEGDATLERGELRVESTDGGVEDGPGHWRRVLVEALGL